MRVQVRLVPVIAFLVWCWPVAGVAQHIQRTGDEATLVLPPAMKAALRSFDPQFRVRRLRDYLPYIWQRPCRPMPECGKYLYRVTSQQAPFAVVGDFNGDMILDVVVDGANASSGRRVALLSRGTKFVASELSSASTGPHPEDPIEFWMYLVRPGRHESGYESRALVLTTDAFLDVYADKGSSIEYYRRGVWHSFVTGD